MTTKTNTSTQNTSTSTSGEKAAKQQPQQTEGIAIVGLSGLFPGSVDIAAFWNHILRGTDLITEVPKDASWSVDDYFTPDALKRPATALDKTYARRGGFLPKVPFETLKEGIPPSLLPSTDTAQLLSLMVARTALEECFGGPVENADRSRVSCILGVTSGQELFGQMASRLAWPQWIAGMRAAGIDDEAAKHAADEIAKCFTPWSEASFPGLLGNVVAGRIANRLDLGGSNAVTDAACASSFAAISMGVDELLLGRADCVLTGGVDTLNDIFMHMCFTKTPALSAQGECRPFDASADGTLLGEGLGMLALKRLSDAERDGNVIYAVIKGIGTSSDGRSKSVYAPVSEGQAKALVRAYEAAGYAPSTVELVEAHGTGTKAGDAAELGGLQLAFDDVRWARSDRQFCAIGSVKSQIGHTKSAAGAAGIVKAALALHEKVLPPTIKVDTPNPAVDFVASPFYVNTRERPWFRGSQHPRRAGVSSFGFGGSNWHITLEEYVGAGVRPSRLGHRDVEVLALGAASTEAVQAHAKTLLASLPAGDDLADLDFGGFCADENANFDVKSSHRAAFVVTSATDLKAKLATLSQGQKSPQIFVGTGAPGKVAFVFPGQGSQQVDMGAALALHFDAARAVWDRAVDVLPDVVNLAHPAPAFGAEQKKQQLTNLTQTQNAQPALGMASMATFAVLRALGVSMDLAGGHSFGELSALCAAGAIDEGTLLSLARRRGSLMATSSNMAGAMAAVLGDVSKLPALLAPFAPDVVVANENSPEQSVISGEARAVNEAIVAIEAAGLRVKRLTVSTAFHSPLVASACAPLLESLKEAAVAAPTVPVFANTSAAPHGDADAIRLALSEQVRAPVRFVDEVKAMSQAGAKVFIEVGPGSVLTGLVGRIVPDATAIAVDPNQGLAGTFAAFAKLCAAGVSLDLTKLPSSRPRSIPKKPSKTGVMVGGANVGRPAMPAPKAPAPRPVAAVVAATVAAAPLHATPPRPEAPMAQPPRPAAPLASMTPTTTPVASVAPTSGWLQVFQEGQQQTATAHQAFQQALADAHTSYLRTMEASTNQLIGALTGQAVAAAPAMTSTVMSTVPAPVIPMAPVVSAPMAAPPTPVVAPIAAAPVAAPVVVVAAQSTPAVDVRAKLFAVVADKTGYPATALDDAMHLESDLGIDSIKRVEILGALKEQLPAAQQIDALKLAQLATLGEIAAALKAAGGTNAAAASAASAASAAVVVVVASSAPTVDARAKLFAVVADKTGYPVSSLEDAMHLESDLGIDSIKRVEILGALKEQLPAAQQIDALKLAQLATLGEIASALNAAGGVAPAPAGTAVAAVAGVDARALLFAVVADKTGYPVSSLEDAMHLESDLGIDSIKRVEILGALKDQLPAAQQMDALKLAQLATLGEIASALNAVTGPAVGAAPAQSAPAMAANVDARALLFAVVADKTGYPVSSLEDAMHLESDLGIDSIKRVEILGALKDQLPAAQQMDALKLAQLATLGEIAGALTAVTGTPAVPATTAVVTVNARALLFAVVADKTGYPVSSLEDAMHLESDLGIDSIKRVEILGALKDQLPAAQQMDALKLAQLATLGEIASALDGVGGTATTTTTTTTTTFTTEAALNTAPTETCPRAVVRLQQLGDALPSTSPLPVPVRLISAGVRGQATADALSAHLRARGLDVVDGVTNPDVTGTLVDLSALDAADPTQALKAGLFTVQRHGQALRQASGRLLLVSAGGGRFGHGDGTANATLGLSGLVKTARLEWPEVQCALVDVEGDAGPAVLAEQLLAELFETSGIVEVGVNEAGRTTPVVVDMPIDAEAPSVLRKGDVVVVTGGARGVTATCLLRLTGQTPGLRLAILQRTTVDAAEPAYARGLDDEGALKRAILADAAARGATIPLREVAQKAQHILAAREVRATLDTLGARADVALFACDMQRQESVQGAIAAVVARFGRVDAIVHGAGVLADKRIEDKTMEQVDRVIDTKVAGLQSLLAATADQALKVVVAFSSVAGRFGNIGQVDYAMANEAMTGLLRGFKTNRPDVVVKSLHWGPWAGGMVTAELKAAFAQRGIVVIERDDGAAAFVAELSTAAGPDLEVVLGAGLADDGSAVKATPTAGTTGSTKVVMSAATMPWMRDHAVKGEVVLPVVVATDLMARLAGVTSLHKVEVIKGQRLPRFEGEGHVAEITIVDDAEGRGVQLRVDGVLAYRARFGGSSTTAPHFSMPKLGEPGFTRPIYGGTGGPGLLFHGPAFHLVERLDGESSTALRARVVTNAGGRLGNSTLDTCALDAGLQLVLLLARRATGGAFLPTAVGSVTSYAPIKAGALDCLVEIADGKALSRDAINTRTNIRFIDDTGAVVLEMKDVSAHRLFDDDAFGTADVGDIGITAPPGAAE